MEKDYSVDKFLFETSIKFNFEDFLTSKDFTDAKLIIGKKCFDVHRLVLAFRSPFFKALFSKNWNQSTTITLDEEFLDPEIMEDLLKFMYSNTIYLTTENVYSLCIASHFLQMEELLKETEKYLEKHFSLSNVFDLLKLSKKFDLIHLRATLLDFLSGFDRKLLKNPLLMELSYDDIDEILSGCKINKNNLQDWFEFIMDWIQIHEDQYSDKIHKGGFMHSISYGDISFDILIKKVASNHYFLKEYTLEYLLEEINRKITSHEDKLLPINECKLIVLNDARFSAKIIRIININYNYRFVIHINSFPSISAFGYTSFRSNVYFAGGKDENGEISNELRMFNCHTMKFKSFAIMPEGRYCCGIAYLNDYLYISGGYNKVGKRLSSVVRYCLTTETWSNVPSMLQPRAAHRLIEAYGCLYAIGGHSKNIEEFSPNKNKWRISYRFDDIPRWISVAKLNKEYETKIMIIQDEILFEYDPYHAEFYMIEDVEPYSRIVVFKNKYFIISNGNITGFEPNLNINAINFMVCEYNASD